MTGDYIREAIVAVLGLAAAGELVGLALRLMFRTRRDP